MITFGTAREAYTHQSGVRSQHTLDAYLRAIDLFMMYLDDRQFKSHLPIRNHLRTQAEVLALQTLVADDEPILQSFAIWLQTAGDGKRPYALSTVELRLAGVLRWFEFMQAKEWLPAEFSLINATDLLRQYLASLHTNEPVDKSVEFSHDLSDLVDYYANQQVPLRIQKSPEQSHRWDLTRLRNHALLQTLAETGGQVSAILSLSVEDVESQEQPLVIGVSGKSEHIYQITLDSSLAAVRAYLKARGSYKPNAPLFVSHDTHYEGKRMSWTARSVSPRSATLAGATVD
jgi:site-specific recombinase XerD